MGRDPPVEKYWSKGQNIKDGKLTMNVKSGWRAEPPVGHVLCNAGVVGPVLLSGLI